MLNSCNFDDRFIGMPLVRIQVKKRHKLYSHIIEQRGKGFTPITDRGMRNIDIKNDSQDQAYVTERVFAEIEHRQRCNDQINRVTHPLVIVFAE